MIISCTLTKIVWFDVIVMFSKRDVIVVFSNLKWRCFDWFYWQEKTLEMPVVVLVDNNVSNVTRISVRSLTYFHVFPHSASVFSFSQMLLSREFAKFSLTKVKKNVKIGACVWVDLCYKVACTTLVQGVLKNSFGQVHLANGPSWSCLCSHLENSLIDATKAREDSMNEMTSWSG